MSRIVETLNRCIQQPGVIETILAHLKRKEPSAEMAPEGRVPARPAGMFDWLPDFIHHLLRCTF